MNIANEEAAMLYRIASQDRRAFLNLNADAEIDLRIVCFHAQQAVEKLLKAVLVRHGIIFSRTHNLANLSGVIVSVGSFPFVVSLLNHKGLANTGLLQAQAER